MQGHAERPDRNGGDRYCEGTYFIAGLIMAGEIFREVMEILEPLVGPAAVRVPREGSGPTAGRVGQMTEGTAAWVGADRWSDNAGTAIPEIASLVERNRGDE